MVIVCLEREVMPVLPKFPTPLRGSILAATVFCGMAFAQTGLTTIQDTLFKADGTRFTGTLSIQWSTFDASSIGTIVQQSKSVSVTNGNLQVSLVPNATAAAPANVYTVHYRSDGNQQFTETWSVPASSSALTVAQVRIGMLTGSSSSGAGTSANQTPIVESAVVGLVSDLAQRPIKGPGFGTGSVAVINQNGQIEAAVGDVGECIYVDGTSGPCGGAASQFFDAETPGGIVDGSNTTFTLLNPPSGSSLMLFRNGLYMSASLDYTLSGATITFPSGAIPQPGDTLIASYRIDPSSSAGNIGALSSGSSGTRTLLAQVLCSSNGASTSQSAWVSLGSCDVAAAALKPGDRIEVRFSFTHTGATSGYDIEIDWGSTPIIARHALPQDAAFVGDAEAAVAATGVQVTVQSWGTVLPFLPGVVSAPVQSGVKVALRGKMSGANVDSVALTSFTVLRYPAN
jgi:hypothetical protein